MVGTIRPIKSIRAGENLSLLTNGLAVIVLVKAQGCNEPSRCQPRRLKIFVSAFEERRARRRGYAMA